MKALGGILSRRKGFLALAIMLLVCCLLLPGPTPARAGSGASVVAIGAPIAGVIFTPLIIYGLYRNLPSQQGKPETIFPGEFYMGLYMGASLANSQDLKYEDGASVNNGVTIRNVNPFTLSNNKFQPGVVGGLKFGYFLKSIPYLGLEADMNFAPSRTKHQNLTASPAVLGSNQIQLHSDNWVNWIIAGHIVGRYGFLKDAEVPFGRLQPYVGIGPGFTIMYDSVDSAKNLSIDVEAGIRYMLLKNVSAFFEYKYNHVFDAEMESHQFFVNGAQGLGTAHLPFDLHRFVVGVCYHF
jgi:opacity protein-like surface antigen